MSPPPIPTGLLEAVLDALPCGAAILRGEAHHANPAMLEILGVSDAGRFASVELRDEDGTPLPADRSPLHPASVDRSNGPTVLRHSTDSGAERWCRWTRRALDVEDGRTAVLVIAEDVTALRQFEEALTHAQKMDAVGRLAGSMAHDFNNLLTAILGFGELLLEGLPERDPGREDAQEIVRSATRGRDLTDQLLSFSRRRPREATVFDVNDGIRETHRLLTRLVGAGVALEAHLDPEAGSIRMDRTEFEQILVNLALNARDAVADGSSGIEIRTGSVALSAPRDAEPHPIPAGEWETVAVSDHGAGMAPEVRRRVFEPFFTTKPPGQGTGLGLATVLRLVRGVHGHVEVDSRPGEGTTFRVYLPATRSGSVDAATADAASPRGGNETVLLVEDQDAIRSLLTRQLQRAGFDVLQAPDGRAALQLWRSDPERVDIVVSDVVMPVVDGPTMVAEMRRSAPRLPVVFVSGFPGAADASERETPLPESTLLRKPFAAAELIEAVRDGLDQAAARRDEARTL